MGNLRQLVRIAGLGKRR